MIKQNEISDTPTYKIIIEGSLEELQRISIFLDNNYIKHFVRDTRNDEQALPDFEAYLDWPMF